MSQVVIGAAAPETTSCSRRFGDLRGVRWRIDLGVLPSCPSASIDDLRRVTANSRRRYASLRRRLLVDPNLPKDGTSSPDVVIDNPLSQNPDSMWGRFFKNAELEKMVDQDLTRLYPERFDYFHTNCCQVMLRRILLLWCLQHPEYGYRQGMHELLAPLLYVLHSDAKRLSEVRNAYADHFADKFDGFSFHENDLTYSFDFKKFSAYAEDGSHGGPEEKTTKRPISLGELDSETQNIVLLSDAYGAEGELGVVLSEKFMEHDAYSLFDALMIGPNSANSMAGFFSPSPFCSSSAGLPPVIEASAAIYHMLSVVDSSLYSHLVELGVEPQYFALRWLRVLFGREFSLEDLLLVWDEIFACENAECEVKGDGYNDKELNFAVLNSRRGSFIIAFAVSMILNLRSSLLSTEIATACLQRLLNFPDDVKLAKVILKAKSLQALASDANNSKLFSVHPLSYDEKKKPIAVNRGHSLSVDSSTSPRTPLSIVPESYWEEKWRVLHREEEDKKGPEDRKDSNRIKGWASKVKLRLSRTESDPSPSIRNGLIKIQKPSVRRSLLDDLRKQLGSDEDERTCNENENVACNNNSSVAQSPVRGNSDEDENISEQSSVASNSSIVENEAEPFEADQDGSPLPISDQPNDDDDDDVSSTCRKIDNCDEDSSSISLQNDDGTSSKCSQNGDSFEKSATIVKEKKVLITGKFQWLWRFGRNAGEGEDPKICNGGIYQDIVSTLDSVNGLEKPIETSKGETTVDQNMLSSLKSLGQSMLENIQVIESVFQQQDNNGQRAATVENSSKNGIVGKGQVTAMAALTELRKISNLLSEM